MNLTSFQQNHLADCDTRYGEREQMLGLSFHSPGYHTRVPSGQWVHPTVPSLEYALLLARTGEPARQQRASTILQQVLNLQDTDPASPTYGIWPYLLEEPIAAMAGPDFNWADFCGARIAEALAEHRWEAALTARLRAALGHAAWCILRRNIRPAYTNICLMGGGVTAVAGELLGEPRLLEYGRARLEKLLVHARYHGNFTEYNSPAYTTIALHETERILQLSRDPVTRDRAEQLRRIAWQTIATHFHAGLQQWAGPHARAYSDRLDTKLAAELSERTGIAIHAPDSEPESIWTGPLDLTVRPLPCPDDLRSHFRNVTPGELRQVVIRRQPESADTEAVTWVTDTACLGSINQSR